MPYIALGDAFTDLFADDPALLLDPPQAIPGFTPDMSSDPAHPADQGSGIDWTQVITMGEQVIGGILRPGQTYPSNRPVYTATSTALGALSNPMTLLLLGGVVYFAMRKR